MLYTYKAVNEAGLTIKGTLQAPDKFFLKAALEQQKFHLIRANPARINSKFKLSTSIPLPLLEEFCLQMATFDRAGLTLLQSLEILREATENHLLKISLIQTIQLFQSGISLSTSFKSVTEMFDSIFCSMIEAGEQTGNLATTFDQLAQLYQWRYALKSQIWKSLQYPLILAMVVLGLIGLMFTWTIPQMAEFFVSLKKELPFSTRFLISVSQHSTFIIYITLSISAALVLIIVLIRVLSAQGTVWIDRVCLNLPMIGKLMKKVDLHRFLQVFISLSKTNIPLISALEGAIKNVKNLYLQQQLSQVRQDVLKGLSFSESWQRQSQLDLIIGRLILTGEYTGQLNQTLSHGIKFLKRDIDQFSQKFTKALEPALIIFLGTILGWIVIAIFLPLYNNMIMIE